MSARFGIILTFASLLGATSSFASSFSPSPRALEIGPVVATAVFKDVGPRNVHVELTVIIPAFSGSKARFSDEYELFSQELKFEARRLVISRLLEWQKPSADSLGAFRARLEPELKSLVEAKASRWLSKHLEKKEFPLDAFVSGIYLTSLDVEVRGTAPARYW